MLEFTSSFGTLQPLLLIVGGILLVAGRRLFWFVLGAAGFIVGWQVATEIGAMPGAHLAGIELSGEGSDAMRLGFAAVVGLAGMVLAFVAQKVAVMLAGIALGGLGALWLLQPFAADLGPWIWALAAIGALIGIGLAGALFRLALVGVSSWVGAGLVTEGLDPAADHRLWIFGALLVVGLLVQSRGRSRSRDPSP